ncbi:hypothetical protein ABZS96_20560 [Streptomyces avermitilis]|uniref:hypothetical protein n=1 Tax=Streptomyces avermitilis TaxID=33903 RepID=UPI0033A64E3A
MTVTARGGREPSATDLMSRRRDMISRLADAGVPQEQAAADVDALCGAALAHVARDLALQIAEARQRCDAARDWITRDSIHHQLRGLVYALATVLGNPKDTKAAHGYARSVGEKSHQIIA